ncbi:hypothetical protein NDU88_011539 [Pleurodeles waltl]|uniref:Uncharacterized protein n=1 Tax=Pleurodeles waltl TaxID=8319 RepID=A0AAV7R3C5_PLEWA|nr:hypothetical protein NDU88_011539 [Pleurodeles waltl]
MRADAWRAVGGHGWEEQTAGRMVAAAWLCVQRLLQVSAVGGVLSAVVGTGLESYHGRLVVGGARLRTRWARRLRARHRAGVVQRTGS